MVVLGRIHNDNINELTAHYRTHDNEFYEGIDLPEVVFVSVWIIASMFNVCSDKYIITKYRDTAIMLGIEEEYLHQPDHPIYGDTGYISSF